MAASLALVGCSSEEDVLNGGTDPAAGETGYVAVNIVQPESVGTRANASTQFEDGSDAENKAETGLFFIYDKEGTTMYGDPQVVDLTNGDPPGSSSPYVEKIYKAILVIDGVKTKPTDAYQIVCVLNAPDELKSLTSTTNLTDLRAKIDNYGAHTDGAFIMTNSVYKNGSDEVCGAIIESDKLKQSAPAALADPVDIYVERVVAKVRVGAAKFDNQKGATAIVDGAEKKLTIKVTGVEIANIADKAYLFKSITGITYDSWTWNDATNKRSYWETVPATTGDNPLTFSNKTYNEIANDSKFDITQANFTEYIQPNTTPSQKTSILVTAELMDGENPADLAYIRGGYTTKEGAKNIIASYLQNQGYYKGVTESGVTTYTSIAPEDIEWKNNNDFTNDADKIDNLKSYEVVAQVKASVTGLYKKNSEGKYETTDVATINTLLKGKNAYFARLYGPDEENGKCLCYYFVNIDQTPVAIDNGYTEEDKFEGVIRNHIYDLTLNSIEGIGIPVFDPDEDIIPETPDENEDLWYLGARVNVLKWRLVKQTVNFKGE